MLLLYREVDYATDISGKSLSLVDIDLACCMISYGLKQLLKN